MKKCKKVSIFIAGALIVGGLILIGFLLHNAGAATTASQVWLYGALGIAPVLIGGAMLGLLNHRSRCHRRGEFFTGRGHDDCRCGEHGAMGEHGRRDARGEFDGDAIREFRGDAIAYWRRKHLVTATLCGIVLIAFGVGAMLYNTGWIAAGWSHVFISWQMLLILCGFGSLCDGKGISGTVLLLVGGFFIAPRVAAMFPAIFETTRAVSFFPVLLIALGVIVVLCALFHNFGSRRRCGNPRGFDPHRHNFTTDPDVPQEEVTTGDGRINENLRFSGMDKVILDPVFRGGNITARGAGAVLDLRRTSLPEGDTVLNLDISWGGVNIIAPNDWHIELNNDCSFGGFVDKRFDIVRHETVDRRLIINVHASFAGGQISSSR